MLKARRLARIIEILREEGFASLGDIADRLDTSVSTIRRDIDHLAEIGPVTRTHGGAVLNPAEAMRFEPGNAIASELAADAKAVIGRHAAELIAPGQTVLFDSGTTTRAVARAALARNIPFAAFTNDIAIAELLSASDRVSVDVFAGRVRPGTTTLMGAQALSGIARIRADLSFVGTHAGSAEGVSDTSAELAEIKRAFVAAGEVCVLVADRTKFSRRSLCLFASLADFDRIVLDEAAAPEVLAALEAGGATLDIAGRAGAGPA